ncbi:TPA: hypothetical protein SMW50_005771 [Pseudomonas aeruginosa]|nr:hypothetical protein [Pseudomonas aeruginosa]EIU2863551.1 hypothetical protein [Pseudomonas aeruginosa]HEJ2342738.1 hypothetical protein [Pseudomonas aeruginosa]HEK3716875.1 hypothetical protein [Pseudomonas aeruginosa]
MPVAIPVSAVTKHCNPYGSSAPWGEIVRRADVERALSERRFAPAPGSDDHAARIAFLVENPASDPIGIDVGCPVLGYWGPSWMVTDGNHRLAAAIYRGDATISALVDGQMDHAFELFGVDCEEEPGKCEVEAPISE